MSYRDREIIQNLSDELDDANKTVLDLKASIANLFNELILNLPQKDFQQLLEDSFTIRELYSAIDETGLQINYVNYIDDSEEEDNLDEQ